MPASPADFVGPVWRRLPRSVRRLRAFRCLRERALGVRVVKTRDQLDAELARLDGAPYAEEKSIFANFRMSVDRGEKLDPASPAYRDRELALYRFISGKDYEPRNDITCFDVDEAAQRPFPYSTQSSHGVGEHLIAVGFAIKMLDLPAGSAVLEFGPGWGNLTIALARMGHHVTAIDIAPDFLELIRRRAKQERCDVTLVDGDFSIASTLGKRFDAVVFFESFHHCLEHRALVSQLSSLTDRVVFAGEPITDDFDVPWGIRLDGESLWAIRRNGWFECGFREDYFRGLMTAHGWTITKHVLDGVPAGTVFVATR